MEPSQSVPDLLAVAQADATIAIGKIAEIRADLHGNAGSDGQTEDLRAATVALELAAVDAFTLFEARMGHHFKRGPFSRKLKAKLLEGGHNDLANRLHQYYLAINVLKHGKGASYRELLERPTSLVTVKPAEDNAAGEMDAPASLIDVTAAGFFDGLSTTLLEAHAFLERK